jgi:hypothetical protein
MADIVRCPYCVLADHFRPMLPKEGGVFRCQKCGHAVVPGNRDFKCHCQKCQELKMQRRCEVVEMASLSDAGGYPCSKRSSQRCSDCGVATCDAHTETCETCGDVFCPSCLSFHKAQARHPKPAGGERKGQERKSA